MTNNNKETQHMTQSILLREAPGGNMMFLCAVALCAAVAGFFAWGALTKVEDITPVSGTIVPNGYVQMVKHLEGGTLTEILAKDGDIVEQGQIVARVEGQALKDELAALENGQMRLELEAERLRRFVYGGALNFKLIAPQDPALWQEEQVAFDAMVHARQQEHDALETDILDQKAQVAALESRQKTLANDIKVSEELLEIERESRRQGSSTPQNLAKAKATVQDLRDEATAVAIKRRDAQQSIQELNARKIFLQSQKKDEALTDLERLEEAIAQNQKQITRLGDRIVRLDIRAPKRGIVKDVQIDSVGADIAGGETLMHIIPIDHRMMVEVQIQPHDLERLAQEQSARVKIDGYDYECYGAIEGVLTALSPTSFTDESGQNYYKGNVVLERNYVGDDPEGHIILPGMLVQADIITGQKSVIGYLMNPIE